MEVSLSEQKEISFSIYHENRQRNMNKPSSGHTAP